MFEQLQAVKLVLAGQRPAVPPPARCWLMARAWGRFTPRDGRDGSSAHTGLVNTVTEKARRILEQVCLDLSWTRGGRHSPWLLLSKFMPRCLQAFYDPCAPRGDDLGDLVMEAKQHDNGFVKVKDIHQQLPQFTEAQIRTAAFSSRTLELSSNSSGIRRMFGSKVDVLNYVNHVFSPEKCVPAPWLHAGLVLVLLLVTVLRKACIVILFVDSMEFFCAGSCGCC